MAISWALRTANSRSISEVPQECRARTAAASANRESSTVSGFRAFLPRRWDPTGEVPRQPLERAPLVRVHRPLDVHVDAAHRGEGRGVIVARTRGGFGRDEQPQRGPPRARRVEGCATRASAVIPLAESRMRARFLSRSRSTAGTALSRCRSSRAAELADPVIASRPCGATIFENASWSTALACNRRRSSASVFGSSSA